MGICNSTPKESATSNAANAADEKRDAARPAVKICPAFMTSRKQEGSRHKPKGNQKNNQQKQRHSPQNVRNFTRRQVGSIPCGKRIDFGYDKDFNSRYTLGKLLGHGQFGYTYVAVDNCNGDRVAVKRIEKNKVNSPSILQYRC